jgi:hypothetical protein
MESLMIVNCEAAAARSLWEEAAAIEQHARDLLAQAQAKASEAKQLESDSDQLAARAVWREADDLHGRGLALLHQAERTRDLSREAVRRANSLPDGADPALLEPVRRVPLTSHEAAERDALGLEAALENLRAERDRRLAASDWTQLPDAPVDREAWAACRQQLRDLPSTSPDPRNPAWPDPPA